MSDVYDFVLFRLVAIEEAKYMMNPQMTMKNPYSDNEPLLRYVPIPTIIAPITSRSIPILAYFGIFDICSLPKSNFNYQYNLSPGPGNN